MGSLPTQTTLAFSVSLCCQNYLLFRMVELPPSQAWPLSYKTITNHFTSSPDSSRISPFISLKPGGGLGAFLPDLSLQLPSECEPQSVRLRVPLSLPRGQGGWPAELEWVTEGRGHAGRAPGTLQSCMDRAWGRICGIRYFGFWRQVLAKPHLKVCDKRSWRRCARWERD